MPPTECEYFNSEDELRAAGFKGFLSIHALRACRLACVPEVPGVYLVLRVQDGAPIFVNSGTGGHFKGGDLCLTT
jgi:hypothetical protein